jgi:hypothetical protein
MRYGNRDNKRNVQKEMEEKWKMMNWMMKCIGGIEMRWIIFSENKKNGSALMVLFWPAYIVFEIKNGNGDLYQNSDEKTVYAD